MKNKKYTFIKFSLLSSLCILPFSVLSSKCTKENKHIDVLLPFTTNDLRFEKMLNVIQKYNEKIQNDTTKLPVNVSSISSRSLLINKLKIQLASKDKAISDLIFYYPSMAYLVASYNRSLDLYNEKFDNNIFSKFLDINDNLGIPSKNIKRRILPVANSSDVLVLNKGLLGYFIYELQKYCLENSISKNIISLDNSRNKILQECLNYYQSLNANKKDEINKKWNIANTFIKSKIEEANFEFNDNIFFNYFDLFNFANTMSLIFNHSARPSDYNSKRIFYSHHSANLTYSMLFNESNGLYKNYFLQYDNFARLKYNEALEGKGIENQMFKKIFDLEAKAIYNKALHFKYSEEDFNRSPFDINTIFTLISSHWAYDQILLKNTSLLNKQDYLFLLAPSKNTTQQENSTFTNQGINLIGININDNRTKQVKEFVNWLYDPTNLMDWNINNKIVKLNPIEYYAMSTKYTFPSKHFIDEYNKHFLNEDPVLDQINNLFLRSETDEHLKIYEDLVDNNSDSFRETLTSVFANLVYKNNNSLITFEKFKNEIKKLETI